MENKIIEFIKKKYNPEVILLGGSRSREKGTEKSDWDLFIFGAKQEDGEFIEFDGARLDVTLKKWPEENNPLSIPYGPLWPIKVLLDESQGKLQKVLEKTEECFYKGPLDMFKEGILVRFERLDSWKRKIEKYSNNPMVEYYYAGFFYEISIRLWFEVRNQWALTPAEGLPVIETEDREFYELLTSFVSANSNKRIEFVEIILDKLVKLKPIA